ncbi:MAG: hypothetical protein Q8L29_02920, partial [archaeon]|nr:hypothetical protein [archaeon]
MFNKERKGFLIMTSIRDVDSRGRMAIVMSGRHSGDISVHDNSSLSEDEIYALAMQVKEWHHNDIDDVIADRKRIVSSLNGRVGSLDIELDWFNDDNFRSDPRKFFSVSVKNKSHVVGKVDSYDERFKSLYESVYES